MMDKTLSHLWSSDSEVMISISSILMRAYLSRSPIVLGGDVYKRHLERRLSERRLWEVSLEDEERREALGERFRDVRFLNRSDEL